MQPGKNKRRLATVAVLLLVWLAIGLASPLVMTVRPGDFEIGTANVNAAPRDSVTLSAPVALSQTPAMTIDRGTVALIHITSKPMSGEAAIALLASGGARLLLDSGLLTVRLDHPQPAGTTDWAAPIPPIISTLTGLNFESLTLRKIALVATLPDGRTETIADFSGEITHRRKTLIQLSGSGRLRGEWIELRTSFGIGPEHAAAKSFPLKLQAKSAVLEAVVDGLLSTGDKPGVHGKVEASIPNVRMFARWFASGWPLGPGLKNLKLKSALHWSAQGFVFSDAQCAMDKNEATGTMSLGTAGERPAFSGTLAFKSLDLTEYASAVSDQRSRLQAWWQGLLSEDHARSLIRLIDADVRISAEKMIANGIEVGRTAMAMSIAGGKLKANVADFEFDGGSGTGEIGLDYSASLPRISVRGKIGGLESARLSKSLIGTAVLSGPITVSADVAASGRSMSDLTQSMAGKVHLSLKDGGRLNSDLKTLLATVQKREAAGWSAANRGSMGFESLDVRLGLRGGGIAVEQATIGTGDTGIAASGTIDPAGDKLDARVVFGAQATPNGKPDALLLSGAFSAPRIRSEAASKAAQPSPERASQPRG